MLIHHILEMNKILNIILKLVLIIINLQLVFSFHNNINKGK